MMTRHATTEVVALPGILGMCAKYAEIVIAMQYREPDAAGTMRGGAMYTLKNGFDLSWLGGVFALLTSLAAFGIGDMVQANSVAGSLHASFGVEPHWTGLVMVVPTAVVIVGGITRIGEFTSVLVPFMAVFYLAGGIVVLVRFASEIRHAVSLVFEGLICTATGLVVLVTGEWSSGLNGAALSARRSRPVLPARGGTSW
jgi:AGCS family alanine or glycine:cation symporter